MKLMAARTSQAEAVNSAANCCRSLYTSILTKDVCELAYAKYKPQ